MNEYVPNPWDFLIIALAAWRLWKLIAEDVILERPVDAILSRIPGERRAYWAKFIECPYCLGFWICGMGYAIWLEAIGEWPGTVGGSLAAVGVWFALSAVSGLIATVAHALLD